MRILVSDPLAEIGVRILRSSPGLEVDVKTDLQPEELEAVIGRYDALVIRSATRVTADVIAAASNLKVIGRAGIGLDNVDIPSASRRGIIVMNTPEGNTVTTAEHTIAMLLALSRNIPQATASLKAGKWEKKQLKGCELYNKTLGLIGAGKIGRIVADRAKGLKMKVIVYDPFLKTQTLRKLDLEPVEFDELLRRSDYITVHTPKTTETTNLINRRTLAKMKKGAMLINCARGGIVNEDDLYEALHAGDLGGAALDVFATEPPAKSNLMELSNFICTPHLGASTTEAQENVARDVAEQILAYLQQGTIKNAVNVPAVSAELMNTLRPFLTLVEKMAAFQSQLAEDAIEETRIHYAGQIAQYDLSPLNTAMLKGLLTPVLKDDVNFVNAPYVAAERGIELVESKSSTSEDFATLIKLTVKTQKGENIVSGTVFGNHLPRILRINNFFLEAIPEGHILLIQSENVPGVIGRVGNILGESGINISRMQVGEEEEKNQTAIFLTTDSLVNDQVIDEILTMQPVTTAKRIEL